ncbi:Variant-specific surface protein, partial [Giardia duodenalis]
VLCGAVPARGGCYSISVAGSGVCREARGGACVRYAEENKTDRTPTRVRVASAEETCPKATDDSTEEQGKCKSTKCDVTIGGNPYCSQCSEPSDHLVDGKCVAAGEDTNKACIAKTRAADGTCGSCAQGYFLHRGGCYKIGQAPGNAICTDEAPSEQQGECKTCALGYFKNPADVAAGTPPCIACNDTAGFTVSSGPTYKGIANCAVCTAPEKAESGDRPATCTACVDGYFAESSGASCTVCVDPCKTCKGANTKCTSCKDTNPYFKKGDGETGECVVENDCKQDSTHFPTTDKTSQKKICTPCSDAANGGITDCQECTPKTAASLAETPSVTCSACTQNKKPNADGTKCIECSVDGCSNCSKDGICETCSDGKKVSPGGSSCVTTCPDNSTEKETGTCLCNEGYSPKDGNCELASTGPNLSTGAIAGISVAAVVVVGGLVGFLCWWFVCRGKA